MPEAGFEIDTFRISGLPRRPGAAQLRALMLAGRAPRACARILASRRPDVVLALTDPPPIGLIWLGAASLRGVPFVLVSKDVFPEVAVVLGHLSSPPVIGAARRVSQRLFRGADRVVSIGRDMDERLVARGLPRDRIATINDWADGSVVRPLDGPSVLRSERGWDGRFVRTIRLLLTRPGELTRSLLEGQRAQFVSPVRLYLL